MSQSADESQLQGRPPTNKVKNRSEWKFCSAEQVENESASRREGISAERQQEKRIAYTVLLQDAGQAMKMCALAC